MKPKTECLHIGSAWGYGGIWAPPPSKLRSLVRGCLSVAVTQVWLESTTFLLIGRHFTRGTRTGCHST